MKSQSVLPTIKMEKILKIVEAACANMRANYPDITDKEIKEKINDVDITFEYLITATFPNIMENIRAQMAQQYIAGYNAGKMGDK